jgi:oligopeptide/dipeptide ABC transporter ATP-binding protein
MNEPLVRATGLVKRYRIRGRRTLTAVDGVSLDIPAAGTLALVGESGCGKSTTGRLMLALERPDRGRVVVGGLDLGELNGARLRAARRQMQPVFQDPYDSLNGRMKVADIVAEPLRVHRVSGNVPELLDMVSLPADTAGRYPHELSGGQRQRVAIARAIALRPRFVVCDEPVSALDVSVQAQVINVLSRLQRELGMAYLFISHDLPLVRYVADETAVMYLGRIVERGPTARLFADPRHPYTQTLLAAAPRIADRGRAPRVPRGDPPSPLERPAGCAFAVRCPLATSRCHEEVPVLRTLPGGSLAACHHAETADIGAA